MQVWYMLIGGRPVVDQEIDALLAIAGRTQGGSHALRQLQQLLSLARTEREEAAVHFELRRVADNPTPHHLRALTLYRALYARTPQYLYKTRIEELER